MPQHAEPLTWRLPHAFCFSACPIGAFLMVLYKAPLYLFYYFRLSPLPALPPARMRRAFPRRPRAAPRSTWRPRRPVRRRGLRGRGGAGPVHVPCPPALGSETPPGPRWAARRALCGGEGELGSRCAPCALDGDSECRFHSRRARPSRGSGGSLAPIPESSGRRECLGCSWGAWALLSCVQLV